MKVPHLLLAGSNCKRIKANLIHLLPPNAIKAIDDEIEANVRGLFSLAEGHYSFAARIGAAEWRQKVSRAYYAVYNAARAVRLFHDGSYSNDVSDHKKIEDLPDTFPNRHMYANRLTMLRDDRNLCDYDHSAVEDDLVVKSLEALELAKMFMDDVRGYFRANGVTI